MEKVNIAELLKDCPSGMELNCTMFNGVYFDHVDDLRLNSIKCYVNNGNEHFEITLDEHGQYISNKSAKCVIFPKGKTTWEGFHRPFKDGDIITCTNSLCSFVAIFKKQLSDKVFVRYAVLILDEHHILKTNINTADFIRPRFATEEEKQKLFQAIKDNGYKWNSETNTLEKLIEPKFKVGDKVKHKDDKTIIYTINYVYYDCYGLCDGHILLFKDQDEYELVPNKFNITKLKPFKSEVLIRNDKTQKWIPAFWGYKADNGNYVTTFGACRYCIPYEGNEHLLRTSNDCDDYYKIWEE